MCTNIIDRSNNAQDVSTKDHPTIHIEQEQRNMASQLQIIVYAIDLYRKHTCIARSGSDAQLRPTNHIIGTTSSTSAKGDESSQKRRRNHSICHRSSLKSWGKLPGNDLFVHRAHGSTSSTSAKGDEIITEISSLP